MLPKSHQYSNMPKKNRPLKLNPATPYRAKQCLQTTRKVYKKITDKFSKGTAKINYSPQKGNAMTPKEAIRVLMLSPFYYKLDLSSRMLLVREFCAIYDQTSPLPR